MKKFWIGISLFLLCFNTYSSAVWAQKATGPRMVLKERSVDYKEVDEGEIIQHAYKVLNQGDQPLHIKNVKPG